MKRAAIGIYLANTSSSVRVSVSTDRDTLVFVREILCEILCYLESFFHGYEECETAFLLIIDLLFVLDNTLTIRSVKKNGCRHSTFALTEHLILAHV